MLKHREVMIGENAVPLLFNDSESGVIPVIASRMEPVNSWAYVIGDESTFDYTTNKDFVGSVYRSYGHAEPVQKPNGFKHTHWVIKLDFELPSPLNWVSDPFPGVLPSMSEPNFEPATYIAKLMVIYHFMGPVGEMDSRLQTYENYNVTMAKPTTLVDENRIVTKLLTIETMNAEAIEPNLYQIGPDLEIGVKLSIGGFYGYTV